MELFKNSSTGQFILNHKGIILKTNGAFQAMTRKSLVDDIVGKNLVEYIFKEDIEEWHFAFDTFFSEDKAKTVLNIRYNCGEEISWWKLYLDKVILGDNSYIFGVAVDISSEIQSQGELREAKRAAEKSEASKSIFLANMSHEIRTPIHTVTGLAELLSDTTLDGEQTEYVSQIDFAAKVLLTLINDILDFSKIEAGKLTFENIEYDLYETIINSVDLSALEAHKKGVDVAISIDRDMPFRIIGDQVRLRQVIVNLMSNAVKFTRLGEIILDVKTIIKDNGETNLKISVTDSGIGISKEKQKRLFQAFSQADASTTREFGGTGLGLSISSSLVQMMGGVMAVESEDAEGSSFFFEIPVVCGERFIPEFKTAPTKELTVLVVDDNKKVNKIFSDILRNWDYNVVEVYNGKDALNELIIKASMGSPYDLCFIDQILPGMDGWQLASEIHSNSLVKPTKTLLMSLKGKGIEEAKMKLLGWFQGYLTKPVSEKDLFTTLEELYSRTIETQIDNVLKDDDIEELESLADDDLEEFEELESLESLESLDDDDDDEYMEPLTFSDDTFEGIEELVPIDDKEYVHELTNFSSMSMSDSEEEVDIFNISEVEEVREPLKILIVEDHLVNQKLFKIILDKAGYNVFVASDGLEAIQIVEANKLDLIFMDCQMPVMNGYDSSELMRLKGYKLPIIAVTASAVKGEYEKCINSGMNDVMTKPFKKEDVMASIEKWMNKSGEEVLLFDYDKALERFMGEKDILIEVIPPYLENLKECVEELKTINVESETTRVRELAHSIKGSSLNLDIEPLGNEAEALEDMAYNNEIGGISEKINALAKIAALTEVELQKYI